MFHWQRKSEEEIEREVESAREQYFHFSIQKVVFSADESYTWNESVVLWVHMVLIVAGRQYEVCVLCK